VASNKVLMLARLTINTNRTGAHTKICINMICSTIFTFIFYQTVVTSEMYGHCSMKFFMAIEIFGNTRRYPVGKVQEASFIIEFKSCKKLKHLHRIECFLLLKIWSFIMRIMIQHNCLCDYHGSVHADER